MISQRFSFRFFLVGFVLIFFGFDIAHAAIPSSPSSSSVITTPDSQANEPEEEPDAVGARKRIFSPILTNVAEAEKMDKFYHRLEDYLWDLSEVDRVHQRALMTLMEPLQFKLTRRVSEFKPGLDKALANLNNARKNFKAYVAKANEEFLAIKPNFREEEAEAQKVWDSAIDEFSKKADDYFKSQYEFLNTYNKLVGYIMRHAGGYYYEGTSQKVAFYKVEEYTYFGEALDRLNKIAYDQRQMLRDVRPPENTNP